MIPNQQISTDDVIEEETDSEGCDMNKAETSESKSSKRQYLTQQHSINWDSVSTLNNQGLQV